MKLPALGYAIFIPVQSSFGLFGKSVLPMKKIEMRSYKEPVVSSFNMLYYFSPSVDAYARRIGIAGEYSLWYGVVTKYSIITNNSCLNVESRIRDAVFLSHKSI
jgi:hypothetical protein